MAKLKTYNWQLGLITLCLLITTYAIMLQLAGKFTAFVAVAALMLHVGFFVQATAVMPEMLVALLSMLAINAYATRRFWLSGTTLMLLLLTKESGVVAGFVLGIAALVTLLNRHLSRRQKMSALLSVAIPVVGIAAFFVLQKQLLGWYFYPEHTNLMSFDWGTFWSRFKAALLYLLAIDGPQWLVKAVCASLVAAAIHQRAVRLLAPVLPLLVAYLITEDLIDFLYTKLQFGIFTFTFACALIVYLVTPTSAAKNKNRIALFVIFCYVYLCFCSFNFYTPRYLMAIIAPVTAGLVMLLVGTLRQLSPKTVWLAPLVIAGSGFFMFRNDKGTGDVNMLSYDAMQVQQATVRFMEAQQ